MNSINKQYVILWEHRIVIPKKLRKGILDELHQNHLGVSKMKSIARGYTWWPNIDKSIDDIAFKCLNCAEISAMPNQMSIHTWEWPHSQWQCLHPDFLGTFKGQLILIKDAYSK